MKSMQIACTNDVGLHARPAAVFVKTANKFKSRIQVRNVTRDKAFVDAKSILRVLSIGVEKDHVIEVTAEGEDETVAVETLETLVRSQFAG